ncbi:MAG: metallophosphoesterase [Nitrosopumilus sp.]|nr:metallophosphoesterase [Nitrosopumilus sp.]MDH3340514.1 metallophosphoesterase [Nitrosopumilus sp.]
MVNHPIISAKEQTVRDSGFDLGKELGQNQDGRYYAAIYERGILMRPYFTDRTYLFEIKTSLLGKPMILNPKDTGRMVITAMVPKIDIVGISKPTSKDLNGLVSVLKNKLVLSPVSKNSAGNPQTTPVNSIWNYKNMVICLIAFSDRSKLNNRQLYNLSFEQSKTEINHIAPHSVYINNSAWSDFGFIHATDIHVSRGSDQIQSRLYELSNSDEKIKPELFNNYNNSFRDFITYANKLHDEGKIDFILATGDLIEYIYEKEDDRNGGGNFEFFRELVLGKGTSPKGISNEELRVPIFTTLGNHDYRENSYPLIFKAFLQLKDFVDSKTAALIALGFTALGLPIIGLAAATISWLFGKKKVHEVPFANYVQYNMKEYEALAFEGNTKDGEYVRRELNKEQGFETLKINDSLKNGSSYYHHYISPKNSYIIKIGAKHKIAMLDTRYDAGITTSTWALLAAKIGIGSEDTQNVIDGVINSIGPQEKDFTILKSALEDNGGLRIVGMHAPPINHANKEYSHFFRETEHQNADPLNTIDFLIRNVGIPYEIQGNNLYKIAKTQDGFIIKQPAKPSDVSTNMSLTGTKYFMKSSQIEGTVEDDISKGNEKLLKICAGVDDSSRQADLILCGHVHRNVEYRIRMDPTENKFEIYHDYYSENPDSYYASRDYRYKTNDGQSKMIFTKIEKNISVPSEIRFNAKNEQENRPFEYYSQRIPHYKNNLNESNNPKEWWEQHKPIIMQGAPLGPLGENQRHDKKNQKEFPNRTFQGFRLIKVENDVIAKINHIELQKDVRGIPRPENIGPPTL